MEQKRRFTKIVGTGGIGVGMLFLSSEMETLGRSESRPVVLSAAKDYCKQHIVLYYPAVLTQGTARVIPIGYVGDDAPGRDLLAEMRREGMDVSYVGVSPDAATMISICLQYPDKEGCNFTAMNNAAALVTPEYVHSCMERIGVDSATIVAAIPEVPLETRVEMIRLGKRKNAYTVLSIPVAEAEAFQQSQILSSCDLLALNWDEARALLNKNLDGAALVAGLYSYLCEIDPSISLLVTCGKDGAYTVADGQLEHIPAFAVRVKNTAGAGDAFLGGTLAGLSAGMPLQKHRNDGRFGETKLQSAAELGALCAGMAVETEDSIAFSVTREGILGRIGENGWEADVWFIS
jgi:sugar/nucleoside kinase (ribokinase family)